MNDNIIVIAKRLGQIHRELLPLIQQEAMIKAQHTKDVFKDSSFDDIDYNVRSRVREAELTLRLGQDTQLQKLTQRRIELEAEDVELTYPRQPDIISAWSLYEDNNKL